MDILKLGPKPRSCRNLYALGDNLPTNWRNLEGSKSLGDWMVFQKNWLVAAALLFAPLFVRNIFFSSSEFDAISLKRYSLTISQSNSLLSASFMAFIVLNTSAVPSSRNVSFSSRNYFSGLSKLHRQFVENLQLMIRLLLVFLPIAGIILTTSLLHDLLNCSIDRLHQKNLS